MMKDECGSCGKKIDLQKGAYGLTLQIVRPEDDPLSSHRRGENHIWSTENPYCSRECLQKSMDAIKGELTAWLQEQDWARKQIERLGFKPSSWFEVR